jgi:small subunit ribosomal protein S6
MRRYELMLVIRPDVPDDRVQGTLDRVTRSITTTGGQIVKVSPWGRRRLAYPIGPHREGSYYIVVFDAPAETVAELERGLHITEESLRHLVTRIERPAARRAAEGDGTEVDADAELSAPPADEDEDAAPDAEFIDESESEAAPAAIE